MAKFTSSNLKKKISVKKHIINKSEVDLKRKNKKQ